MSRNRKTSNRVRGLVRAAGATHAGKIRENNEDAFLLDEAQGLFIVSDGMGGQQAGELAAKVVVRVLPALIGQRLGSIEIPKAGAFRRALQRAVADLSRHLREETASRLGLSGIGATVVAMLVRGRSAHIVHMGDSRAYRLRGSELQRLTEDHSVVGILLRDGEISTAEARDHPARGQLSRFVGMDGDISPDVRTIVVKTGDRFLLCTDGLTGMLSDDEIARFMQNKTDPGDACRALVEAANQAGGHDNSTAIVVNIDASR